MTSSNADGILQLSGMGFDPIASQAALSVSKGNMDQALDILIGASSPATTTSTPPPRSEERRRRNPERSSSCSSAAPPLIIQSPTSQFNVTNGTSACTCIALSAAERFLSKVSSSSSTTKTAAIKRILTPSFLSESIMKGIEAYEVVSTAAASKRSIDLENLSVEDVLSICGSTQPNASSSTSFFSSMELLPGMPIQGTVSSNTRHPHGFKSIIKGCRSSTASSSPAAFSSPLHWTALVVTKSPETVLLCLPPLLHHSNNSNMNEDDSTDDNLPYILIDSHPRPQLFVNGSYAAIHSSMKSLLVTLNTIFPPTELRADIGRTMAMRYNSFDVYALQLMHNNNNGADAAVVVDAASAVVDAVVMPVASPINSYVAEDKKTTEDDFISSKDAQMLKENGFRAGNKDLSLSCSVFCFTF